MDVSSLNSGGVSRRRLFLARGPDTTVAAIVGAMGLTRFGFDAMTIPRYGRKMSAFLSRSVPQPRRERAHG